MKAKRNDIELTDFQEWYESEEVTYARSDRENKWIGVTLQGTITVYVDGRKIHQGTQPFAAVEAYNNITGKWINPFKDFKI